MRWLPVIVLVMLASLPTSAEVPWLDGGHIKGRTLGVNFVSDNSINGAAAIVVMTTEVLRNMIYEQATALDDLLGRLGARVGMDAITRMHPADSHIPEKTSKTLAAAWSEPAKSPWPRYGKARPLLLWRPEIVQAAETPALPAEFRWRGRTLVLVRGAGPDRIAPEWWLDEPDWRSGVRDYWRVQVESGEDLWLYFAHGGAVSPGWFCHGQFA